MRLDPGTCLVLLILYLILYIGRRCGCQMRRLIQIALRLRPRMSLRPSGLIAIILPPLSSISRDERTSRGIQPIVPVRRLGQLGVETSAPRLTTTSIRRRVRSRSIRTRRRPVCGNPAQGLTAGLILPVCLTLSGPVSMPRRTVSSFALCLSLPLLTIGGRSSLPVGLLLMGLNLRRRRY